MTRSRGGFDSHPRAAVCAGGRADALFELAREVELRRVAQPFGDGSQGQIGSPTTRRLAEKLSGARHAFLQNPLVERLTASGLFELPSQGRNRDAKLSRYFAIVRNVGVFRLQRCQNLREPAPLPRRRPRLRQVEQKPFKRMNGPQSAPPVGSIDQRGQRVEARAPFPSRRRGLGARRPESARDPLQKPRPLKRDVPMNPAPVFVARKRMKSQARAGIRRKERRLREGNKVVVVGQLQRSVLDQLKRAVPHEPLVETQPRATRAAPDQKRQIVVECHQCAYSAK